MEILLRGSLNESLWNKSIEGLTVWEKSYCMKYWSYGRSHMNQRTFCKFSMDGTPFEMFMDGKHFERSIMDQRSNLPWKIWEFDWRPSSSLWRQRNLHWRSLGIQRGVSRSEMSPYDKSLIFGSKKLSCLLGMGSLLRSRLKTMDERPLIAFPTFVREAYFRTFWNLFLSLFRDDLATKAFLRGKCIDKYFSLQKSIEG